MYLEILIEVSVFDHQVTGNNRQWKVNLKIDQQAMKTPNQKDNFRNSLHLNTKNEGLNDPNLKFCLARSEVTFLCFVPQGSPAK